MPFTSRRSEMDMAGRKLVSANDVARPELQQSQWNEMALRRYQESLVSEFHDAHSSTVQYSSAETRLAQHLANRLRCEETTAVQEARTSTEALRKAHEATDRRASPRAETQ